MPFMVVGDRDAAGVGRITVAWQNPNGQGQGLVLGMTTAKRLSESLAEAVQALVAKGAGIGEETVDLLEKKP
jgi:hypothetical protein